jgi:sugar lactone lactonase YvrE
VWIENSGDADESPFYVFTINATAVRPEINVQQGGVDVPDGAGSYTFAAPVLADGPKEDMSPIVTFVIQNLGSGNLTISGVSLSGDTKDFILNNTTSSPVESSGTTTFTVRFDPLSVGAKSATVTINNTDLDENPYIFTVSGTANKAPKIYWTDRTAGSIMRANLNGSNAETLLKGLASPNGIALDVANGRMYWTELESGQVNMADPDSAKPKTLFAVSSLYGLHGIALDLINKHIYVAGSAANAIGRANLDGSGFFKYIGGVSPQRIALDHTNGYMYWSERGADRIVRVVIGGVKPAYFTGLTAPVALAVDPAEGTGEGLLYLSFKGAIIGTSDPLISKPPFNALIKSELEYVEDIALDLSGKKLYWADGKGRTIGRANLDGTEIETIIRAGYPSGVALDIP